MPVILPFASGKGGVGKTLTAVHTAVALAQLGKTVILIDADLGGSNLHTLLGIKNRNPGLGSLVHRQEKHIDDLILSTRFERLYLIPGDGQLSGTANPPVWFRRKLQKEIQKLVCDFVILDLGAGIGTFILDGFLFSHQGIVVTTPEIPALLNGYGFIKNAALRIFQQHTKNRSPEGKIAIEMNHRNLDSGSGIGLDGVLERIRKENPDAAENISRDLKNFKPRIILNMGTHQRDLSLGSNIQKACERHLGVDAGYLGLIPWHPDLRNLINTQKLLFDLEEMSSTKRAFLRLGQTIVQAAQSTSNRPVVQSFEELTEGLWNED
ncbi:MAG: MinD/ParA family protein [Spirochaetales bacterium]|nr:MinD/ParA family protein [Spirochaetales bacterium]